MREAIKEITREGEKAVLIVYTGGTFGMIRDENGSLVPFDFEQIEKSIPELGALHVRLSVLSFPNPIDSSNIHSK